MADEGVGAEALTPVKRALLEIRELRAELARTRESAKEPIAIVGMGLRLPGGVTDAEGFARLLWSGTDAIQEIPKDRWSLDALYAEDPDAPGKMITRHGGFIDHVDCFDAHFFGISPREAASMDPQQRLLLQVAWEALEDAGHAPGALAGSRTGVYLGICNSDYGRALFAHREAIDAYVSTGNACSVASGRLSYFLGLHGPCVAVDTACSSSLVALHLACQALRLGEADRALVGGVNLVLTPEMNINFSKARMMAPDGRCKTFDAAADGYVRGEGCAMIVLRRLSDAVADGDRVRAVVRGSAINQDGRSGGLTAPNGPAQEAVLKAALASAGVTGPDIGFVEAHGTGTPLGDPIEVGALSAVLCAGRDASHPLAIGSVKTNIGHLEAAAGLAGLIKVVLGLGRREIPPHLHFQRGNPLIDWNDTLTVPTKVTPWAPIRGRRLAGLSSFGFSGTNAHVILEEVPAAAAAKAPAMTPARPLHLLALSARDPESLGELAIAYEDRLRDPSSASAVADICFTANAGRSHFEHRLAVVGATAADLSQGLSAYAKLAPNPAVASGTIEGSARPQVAFLFTGHGAHSVGMGRALYETSPVFRNALDACAAGLAGKLPRGLLDVMFSEDERSPINDSAYAQPSTFAIEYALAELWRSWGIEPVAVLGHSLGEYAAACVAGLFSLEDGLRMVAERGRLNDELPPGGAMGTVFASAEVVEPELARLAGHHPRQAWIAGFNGPEHVVVSGSHAAVEQVLGAFEARGVRVKMLRVPYASHTPMVEPALPGFRRVLETVTWRQPRTAIVANVTGTLADYEKLARPEYWLSHLRQPVRFAQSMQAVVAQGITHFVEIGPHPVLLGMAAECVTGTFEWLPSLRRDRPDWSDLLESLQRLYVSGAEVNWAAFDRDYPRRRVALPTYPFRKRRHWSPLVGRSPSSESDASTPMGAVERWSRVTSALARQAERGPLDLNAASYPAKWAMLERLTTANAMAILRASGLFAAAGEKRTLDEVMATSGIRPNYRHLVRRWLDRMGELGALRMDGDNCTALAPLAPPDLPSLWAEAERAFADNQPLFAYFRHCCDLAARVLLGAESPLETLFPGGSFDLAEGLYERSTTMRYVNALAAAALETLGAAASPTRVLRVLEVGAGTGGTTGSLLPLLPADRTQYVFTDVSDLFLDRARERFAAYPFVECRRFDVDKDPAPQGFPPGTFDVIVSANAIHASVDLKLALRRLRALLAPGGVLVLVESTTHLAWFDITTGLIEGWQHFADDLRTDNPLLPPATWLSALREAGFEEAGAWPQPGSTGDALGQHVIAARVPGETAGATAFASTAGTVSPTTARTAAPGVAKERAEAFRQRLLEALPSERLAMLRDFVRERVMVVLRLDESRPPGKNDRLMDLGFDSLMAVQLRNALSTGLGFDRPLPATTMFDYPTIDALAGRFLDLLAPAPPPLVEPTRMAIAMPTLGAEAVAGMSDAEVEAALLKRLEGK
jgi:acyl transferase domain-containing protein